MFIPPFLLYLPLIFIEEQHLRLFIVVGLYQVAINAILLFWFTTPESLLVNQNKSI